MRRRARRAVAARVGGVVLALGALAVLTTAPASAQEPGTTTTTAPTTPGTTSPTGSGGTTGTAPTGPGLDLLSQTPFVAPTDLWRVRLDVAGAPEGAELTFALHLSVQTARDNTDTRTAQARFDDFVAGRPDTTTRLFNSPKTFPVANLPGYGSGPVDATFEVVPEGVDPPLVGFQISDAGVYPMTIELRGPEGGPVLDSLTTFLVRLPTSTERAPALAVAPIAEVRAPVALAPDGTREIEGSALDRIHDLIDAIAERPDVALTIGATPETLEALTSTATVPATPSAPATTGPDLIDRLQGALADRSVLGSPYVVVDVSAWTASSMGEALAYQLSHGVNVAEAVLEGAAPIDRRTWVADPDLDASGLVQLHDLGIDQVVLPDRVVSPIEPRDLPDASRGQLAQSQPFDVEDGSGARVRAVTADARFAERLVATDDEALNAQILVADLAVTYFGATNPQVNDVPDAPRGVAFEVPDDELAIASFAPFLAALATTPPPDGGGAAIVAPATLATLFAIPPATTAAGDPVLRSFTAEPPPNGQTDMGDYPERLDAAEFAVSAYESMVVETAADRVRPLRQLLDVSGAAPFSPAERQAYLDSASASVDAALDGVRVPDQDSITLTASEYEIPIVLENDLTYPVAVRVVLDSSKLTFPDGTELEVQLQPGSNRVPVRVKTVSAGTFPLDLSVTTPDQREDLGQETIEVRSTAVSGLGLALTIGAGFFLLVWWARNWRNTRRATVGSIGPDGGDDGGERGSGAGEGATGARFTVGPLADLRDPDDAPAPGTDDAAGPEPTPPVVTGPGGVGPETPK